MYGELYRRDVVTRRIATAVSQKEKDNLLLVEASLVINESDVMDNNLLHFRAENKRVFGEPRYDYLCAILGRIGEKSGVHTELWQYIQTHVDYHDESASFAPSHETFLWYKNLFAQYFYMPVGAHISLVEALRIGVETTGLAKKGWQVSERSDASHARVNHATKKIFVGREYVPRRRLSINMIVAHEVYGHAVRGVRESMAESEGFAIVLEQLLAPRFAYRRTFRYVAAALGWGVDGRPRTFRQVYEIIWRLMVVVGRYDEATAKSHAFDECARVFRGGRPDVPGAVYLKDMVYFAANVEIWQQLDKRRLSYNEFITFIEGKGVLG